MISKHRHYFTRQRDGSVQSVGKNGLNFSVMLKNELSYFCPQQLLAFCNEKNDYNDALTGDLIKDSFTFISLMTCTFATTGISLHFMVISEKHKQILLHKQDVDFRGRGRI